MIITTTGFFNTGSSAITHLLKEFDSISNTDNVYEMRLLYDPDCISDLEYNLTECPHRQNTSHAICRFKKYIDYNSNPLINHHYEKMCNGNFKKLSYKYIVNISNFNYKGISHIEAYDKGYLFSIVNRVYQKFILTFFSHGRPAWIRDALASPNTNQYAGTYDIEKFLSATQDYLRSILSYCKKGDQDFILIDQLIPPTCVERYARYLPPEEELRVFIVDRDPRDLYITCKYFLRSYAIPCNNPNVFCDWYLWTRGQSRVSNENNSTVMRIRFEDLIYEYESTRDNIIKFCGLSSEKCSKKRQVFRPELSINNTQVWKRFEKSREEAEEIRRRLPEYCYDFDSKDMKPDYQSGKMFDC